MARLIPTPPAGDMAWAASPMQSKPGRYHWRRRLICTVRILIWSQSCNSFTRSPRNGAIWRMSLKRIEATRLDCIIGALGNDEAGLKIVGTVDQDQCLSVVDIPQHVDRVVRLAADVEPQHVDGDSVFDNLESGRFAHRGMSSVTSDDEIGANLDFPSLGLGGHARNSPALFHQVCRLMLHEQVKRRKSFRVTGKKIQKS